MPEAAKKGFSLLSSKFPKNIGRFSSIISYLIFKATFAQDLIAIYIIRHYACAFDKFFLNLLVKRIDAFDKKIQFLKSLINLLMRDDWLIDKFSHFLSVAINRQIPSLSRAKDLTQKYLEIAFSAEHFPLYSAAEKTIKYQQASTTAQPIFKDFEHGRKFI